MEFPFTSERKRMSTIVQDTSQIMQRETGILAAPYLLFSKGSPELILERCTQIQIGESVMLRSEERRVGKEC